MKSILICFVSIFVVMALPGFQMRANGGAAYAGSLEDRSAHCILPWGEGTLNWSTGTMAVGSQMERGETRQDGTIGLSPSSILLRKERLAFPSFRQVLFSDRWGEDNEGMEEKHRLEAAGVALTRMLERFVRRYDPDGAPNLPMDEAFSVAIGKKVRDADILFSNDGFPYFPHDRFILTTTVFGDLMDLLFPSELVKIPDIEVVDPQNQYGKDEKYTGMVVDARHIPFAPTLYPVVVDEQGKEVYGPLFASRDYAVQKGLCSYAYLPDPSLVTPRVGRHPVWVKGLRQEGKRGDRIVIPISEAEKVRQRPERHLFLKACKVIVLVSKSNAYSCIDEKIVDQPCFAHMNRNGIEGVAIDPIHRIKGGGMAH